MKANAEDFDGQLISDQFQVQMTFDSDPQLKVEFQPESFEWTESGGTKYDRKVAACKSFALEQLDKLN